MEELFLRTQCLVLLGIPSPNILINKRQYYKKLENFSIQFQNKINSFLLNEDIDAKVYRFQTIIRIVFSRNKKSRISRDFFEKKKFK